MPVSRAYAPEFLRLRPCQGTAATGSERFNGLLSSGDFHRKFMEGVNKAQISDEATLVRVDIVPRDLVKSVHVSPAAPNWFGHLVEQLLKRYHTDYPC